MNKPWVTPTLRELADGEQVEKEENGRACNSTNQEKRVPRGHSQPL